MSVGLLYCSVLIVRPNCLISISRKGSVPLSFNSIVNSRFGCSVFTYDNRRSISATLTERRMSSTYLPKIFALGLDDKRRNHNSNNYHPYL